MLRIEKQVSLQRYNTLALPSIAEYFCQVKSEHELKEALEWSKKYRLTTTVLGEGSNVVLAANIGGLVIHMAILGIEQLTPTSGSVDRPDTDCIIRAGAGENWHKLVRYSLAQGWYGLENLSLIPGLCGAAPIQNIGAYGVELSDVFYQLEAICLTTGEHVSMALEDCKFGYRESYFKGAGRDQYIIIAIQLRLSSKANPCLDYPVLKQVIAQGNQPVTPQNISDAVCRIRQSKIPDPQQTANAGSFFKNPVVTTAQAEQIKHIFPTLVSYNQDNGCQKLAAGWLIEQAGWKGIKREGVGVHPQQALVLVNHHGSAEALLSLARDIQTSVFEKFQVKLEIEPRVYQ